MFMATDFLDFTHLLANAPAIELPDYMAFNEAALGELPPQVMAGNGDPGSSGLSSCAMYVFILNRFELFGFDIGLLASLSFANFMLIFFPPPFL